MRTNLVVGCYERFLFGLDILQRNDEAIAAHRNFSYPAHQAAVKCVALCGSHLASGGLDDQIHLYNIKDGKDLGFLVNPGNGAITSLAFVQQGPAVGAAPEGSAVQGPSHLLSGSQDGSLMVWKAGGSWDALKHIKGHKAAVNGIAVHSSGAMALTVSQDRQLRLWNLLSGKAAFSCKLATEAIVVQFSPTQHQCYALLGYNGITLHDIANEASAIASWKLPKKSQCFAWAPTQGAVTGDPEEQHQVLVVGSDDGSLSGYDVRCPQQAVWSIAKAHNARVKGLGVVKCHTQEDAKATAGLLLASACSSGAVKLWDVRNLGSASSSLATMDTGARITCLASTAAVQPYRYPARPPAPHTPDGQTHAPAAKKKPATARIPAASLVTDAQTGHPLSGIAVNCGSNGTAEIPAVKQSIAPGLHIGDSIGNGGIAKGLGPGVGPSGKRTTAVKGKHAVANATHGVESVPGKRKEDPVGMEAAPPGMQALGQQGKMGQTPGGAQRKGEQVLVQRSKREGREVLQVERIVGHKRARHADDQQGQKQQRQQTKPPSAGTPSDKVTAVEGVSQGGIVVFPDEVRPHKKQKKAGKRKKDKGSDGREMPTVEDAELAALEMGLSVDIAAQQEVLQEQAEQGRNAATGKSRRPKMVSSKVLRRRKARLRAAEAGAAGSQGPERTRVPQGGGHQRRAFGADKGVAKPAFVSAGVAGGRRSGVGPRAGRPAAAPRAGRPAGSKLSRMGRETSRGVPSGATGARNATRAESDQGRQQSFRDAGKVVKKVLGGKGQRRLGKTELKAPSNRLMKLGRAGKK